jgi:hypothetical protein
MSVKNVNSPYLLTLPRTLEMIRNKDFTRNCVHKNFNNREVFAA